MTSSGAGVPGGEVERILRARARALARAPEESGRGEWIEIVEFRLGGERYAFEASGVHEVWPLEELTALPCTPAFFVGLANARGRLVPVLDLKKLFDLPASESTGVQHALLLRNHDTQLGVLADAVEGAYSLALDAIQSSLPTLTGVRARYLRGLTADRLVILDAAAILTDPQLIVDEDIER